MYKLVGIADGIALCAARVSVQAIRLCTDIPILIIHVVSLYNYSLESLDVLIIIITIMIYSIENTSTWNKLTSEL